MRSPPSPVTSSLWTSRTCSSCRTSGTLPPTSRVGYRTAPPRSISCACCIREPFDRGRYAGPVGWIDANGDGEWAIALRCAQIGAEPQRYAAAYSDTIPVVAHAGAGIVAASDPETELLETRVKFRPIVDALA